VVRGPTYTPTGGPPASTPNVFLCPAGTVGAQISAAWDSGACGASWNNIAAVGFGCRAVTPTLL